MVPLKFSQALQGFFLSVQSRHLSHHTAEDYENTLDKYGPDSEPARSHIYSLAWELASELEATL